MSSDRHALEVKPTTGRGVLGRWLGKGFWAITDQGLFAISNFGLNVLLARWLTPTEYGAFSVAYTIFLLIGTVHTALLTEPMLVFGPGRYRSRLSAYLSALLRGHWLFGALTGVLFAAAGAVSWRLTNSPMTPALFGLALAAPFILFQWLMRRACYVDLQPRLAAHAGAIYLGLIAAGALALYRTAWLGPATALGIMAFASLVSGAWLVFRLAVPVRVSAVEDLARHALNVHWEYGRWAVGAAGLSWAAGNVPYLVLPLLRDLSAVGALRAAFNFVMPILQVFAALGSVMLPVLVGARARGTLRLTSLIALAAYLVLALGYGIALALLAVPLTSAVYAGRYASLPTIVVVLAFLPLASGATSVLGGALRALERPRAVFWAYLVSTMVSLTVGVALIALFGTSGAAAGIVLTSLTTAGTLLLLVRGHYRRLRATSAPPLDLQ